MRLSAAQKKEMYSNNMEYINEYREGDVFYHVSSKENIESLLRSGFDPKKIGSQGGCQGGQGFSCTWCQGDAWDWGRKIYGWGNEHHLAVIQVSLPGVRIATHQQADEAGEAAQQWGLEQGYLMQGENGVVPSPKFAIRDDLLADYGWSIIGLYLLEQGYDGYFIGIDEVVIMNFNLLNASVFSLVSR